MEFENYELEIQQASEQMEEGIDNYQTFEEKDISLLKYYDLTELKFKSVDCWINDKIFLRNYVEFDNFENYINRWLLLNKRDDVGKESAFVNDEVAEKLMELVVFIEEIEGIYYPQIDVLNIKTPQDTTLSQAEIEKNELKKSFLFGEHEIEWYLFRAKDGTPYLIANRDSNENESLYELDKYRKWKPIHNAPAFDGYLGAEKYFKSISFSYNGKKVNIK